MTCHEFWNTMPELSGEPTPPLHVTECPHCAVLLERQRALAAGLKRLAGSPNSRQAPSAVETRLIQAFRAHAASPPVSTRPHWLGWAAAAALIIGALFLTAGWRSGKLVPAAGESDQAAAESVTDPEFIPLPYGFADPSASAMVQDADLVRFEVPQSALVALGLPVAESSSGLVEAVVALGPDGMLQGIQIVQ